MKFKPEERLSTHTALCLRLESRMLGQCETSSVAEEPQPDGVNDFRWRLKAQGALPNGGNPPAHHLEFLNISGVSCHVLGEFLPPKRGICSRSRAPLAAQVPMPKATMDEDDCFILWKHNIRLAR